MKEVTLSSLPIGSKFYLQLTSGRKIYGTLLSVGRMSATVQVEKEPPKPFARYDKDGVLIESEVKITRVTTIENWDYETLVVQI